MEYIHVKNLEKYHPGYKDGRRMIWIRWEIDAINDYRISKLTPAQRWLFIGLISLEIRNQDQVPFDIEWLSNTLKHPKQYMSKDLLMLQTLELVVTKNGEACSLQMLKQTDVKTDRSNVHFDFDLVWSKYPSKVGKMDAKRHFMASINTEKDFAEIQVALENYKNSDRVKKGYIQNGGRWFLHWKDWVDYKEPVTEKSQQEKQSETRKEFGLC